MAGVAANPLRILSQILAEMHDARGKVTIPGFYEGVEPLPNALKEQWDALGFSHEDFLGDVGLSEPGGETAYTALEQIWSRPTAEINGIWGGYTGAGFKTVIPAEASAKISFRLVGKQDPETLRKAFRDFVTEQLPADCEAVFVASGARWRAPSAAMVVTAGPGRGVSFSRMRPATLTLIPAACLSTTLYSSPTSLPRRTIRATSVRSRRPSFPSTGYIGLDHLAFDR